MEHIISIPQENGWNKIFYLYFSEYSMSQRIEVENVCIIDVYKIHDHRYDLKAFFYKKKYITYQKSIRSKKELYRAIQNLLKQNLYQAVQCGREISDVD